MNATQAENLRILIRHMETNCQRTLDLSVFTTPCGTPACAMGEACTIPELVAQGLMFNTSEKSHYGFRPIFKGLDDSGGTNTFGVEYDQSLRLFSTKKFGRAAVTPQEWAVEARKVLAENGYSMDEAKPIPSVAERLEAIYAGNALTAEEQDAEKMSAFLAYGQQ